MTRLRRTAASTGMMLSLAMGAAAAAEPNSPREMLVGQFICSTNPSYNQQTHGSLLVSGTSGIFVSGAGMSVYADFEAGGLAVCDAFARDARAKLEASGCMASQISASDPTAFDPTARRSVQFVCSGAREKVVDSLSRLAELMVTSGR